MQVPLPASSAQKPETKNRNIYRLKMIRKKYQSSTWGTKIKMLQTKNIRPLVKPGWVTIFYKPQPCCDIKSGSKKITNRIYK